MVDRLRIVLTWGLLALSLTGCELNDYLDPGEAKIVGPDQKPLVVPILDSLASGIEGPDAAFANATEIQPSDMVPEVADYKIGPGDLVAVSVFDLLGVGTGEQTKTARVTETGSISLTFIPPVKAAGLTERQLEDAVAKAYDDARLIHNARVSVQVQQAQAETFSIEGNVGQPGEYEITRPDFRMLDALVVAREPRDTSGIPYVYVIRKLKTAEGGTGPDAEPTPPSSTDTPLSPPVKPDIPAGSSPADLLSPPSSHTGPQSRVTPGESSHELMVMDNLPGAGSSPPFKFDDVETPTDERVIRVPLDQLEAQGELKYNIVIHPKDMIIVPDPPQGYYYMGGHVMRPGVYGLNPGEKMTLKKAWIAAGAQDQFSFPYRTEIIRRVGANREVCIRIDLAKVLALEQPDVYLRPNDMIYVGTHLVAPFLAAVRNSFSLSTGAGLLYDQNFYNGNLNGNVNQPLGTTPTPL